MAIAPAFADEQRILIQAEQAGETKYAGCRSVSDGTYLVGLIGDFELFGNNAPK